MYLENITTNNPKYGHINKYALFTDTNEEYPGQKNN